MLEPFRDQIEVVELDVDASDDQHVDVVLYDTRTHVQPDGPDLDALIDDPRVGRVVLYTWNLTEEVITSARAGGVDAALPKSLDAERLASALRLVHEGRLDVIALLDEPAMTVGHWPGQQAGLTAREAEVIALVTSGLSNNEIARRTYLSINSVKSYIRSAYRTMGVRSRSCAVLWGIDHGMAPNRVKILLPHPDLVLSTSVPRSQADHDSAISLQS